jgi:hypothetical protein
MYHQLHTIGRCMHPNAGARQSQKNMILGLNPYVQGLSAMLYYLCLLSLWLTSSCKFLGLQQQRMEGGVQERLALESLELNEAALQ